MSLTHDRTLRLLTDRVRLGTAARRSLYVMLAALIGSGAWWLAAHYATTLSHAGTDDMSRLAQESLALKVHGATAFVGLFALGAMSAQHVRRAWALRRNRWLGSIMLAVFAILIATGYALYYLVTDETRQTVSVTHWVIGLTLGPLIIWHIANGRRTRMQPSPIVRDPTTAQRSKHRRR